MRGEKRIALCGYYGFGNVGDEATLDAAACLLRAGSPTCELIVFSAKPEETAKRLSCRCVPRMNPLSLLRELTCCDALVFGGGSILQDVTGWKTLWYYLGLLRLAKRFGKETYLMANGIGPLIRKSSRKAVAGAVEKLTGLTLRDRESAELLRACGVKRPLPVSADLVALHSVHKSQSPVKEPYLVVAVRPWGEREDFQSELVKTLDAMAEDGLNIVLVPFHPSYDGAFSRQIAEKLARRPEIFEPKTPEEAASVISGASCVLAMRLHALIFASALGVPAAGIIYDPKVESFLRSAGQESCGTVECFSSQIAAAKLRQLMQEPLSHANPAFRAELAEAGQVNDRLVRQILYR